LLSIIPLQRKQNRLQYLIRAQQHIVVPEAEYAKTAVAKPCITTAVGGRVEMLAAIKLDYEPAFDTNEIDDIRANRMLAAETMATKIVSSQEIPDALLGIGQVSAQLPREVRLGSVAHALPSLDMKIRSAPFRLRHLPPLRRGRNTGLSSLQ
jgi:hypothetical protein